MTAREIVKFCQNFQPYLDFKEHLVCKVPRLASWDVTVSRLNKEKCFCIDRNAQERKCACEIHVQLGYYVRALLLWRQAEHTRNCDCSCDVCVDDHSNYRKILSDCSSFSEAIYSSPECAKDPERNCRPLRCGLGHHVSCDRLDEPLQICVKDYSSERMVRYKTKEPVKSGGKVFDDWIYKEADMKTFIPMLKSFYRDKYRMHNWTYKWQDVERFVIFILDICLHVPLLLCDTTNHYFFLSHTRRNRIIKCFREQQLLIFMDYANKYTHWQQDGATCKQDRQSSHLVAFVLSKPKYVSSARIDKVGHTCEVFTFWNSHPKQTPDAIHAAVHYIIRKKQSDFKSSRVADVTVTLEEVLIFTDRCGEQFSGRKNFRRCSETAMLFKLWIFWNFACPHHFAGVWDAWGGAETRILKRAEVKGDETFRTVEEIVLYLRKYRQSLKDENNENRDSYQPRCPLNESDDDNSMADDNDDESVPTTQPNFKVHGVHTMLLQVCVCKTSVCQCVPDPRLSDTIFYRKDDCYDAETIKGSSKIFSYRFHPRRAYVVHMRQFTCQSCPHCVYSDHRSWKCLNLSTVRCTGYNGPGLEAKIQSRYFLETGWIEHTIVPVKKSTVSVTRATAGVLASGRDSRMKYIKSKKPGDVIMMCNLDECNDEITRSDFWLARLLPRDNTSNTVVWRTDKALPPDVSCSSYCCRIEWLERKHIQSHPRKFSNGSMQYIQLNCIVPLSFNILFDRVLNNCQWLNERVEQKLITAVEVCNVVE